MHLVEKLQKTVDVLFHLPKCKFHSRNDATFFGVVWGGGAAKKKCDRQ